MQTSRRELLAVAALWTHALEAAQSHQHIAAPASQASYAFRFFQKPERDLFRSLAAILIPAGDRSAGASGARVDEYADFVLSHGSPELKRRWRDGLEMLSRVAPASRELRLRELAKNEFAPETRDEEFFVLLKGAVVEAFYTSEEGIRKELGYQGRGFLREFPGCTHEEHETPASYRPLLQSRS